jgi:hypothetical protein
LKKLGPISNDAIGGLIAGAFVVGVP